MSARSLLALLRGVTLEQYCELEAQQDLIRVIELVNGTANAPVAPTTTLL